MVAATGSGLRNARLALSVTLGSRPPSERSGSLLPIADRGIHFAARALRNSPENRHTKLFALLAPASTRSTPTNSGHYDSFRRRLTESLQEAPRACIVLQFPEDLSMLAFADTPHIFYPAKPVKPVMWAARTANRLRILPGPNHRIPDVRVTGDEHLKEARRQAPQRWFFIANHSTHSDPQIILETQRRLGAHSCFMAAYDVFLRNKFCAWVMQHTGCFSVNRDGTDSRAMREAIRILTSTPFGLTVFPEGNVYLMNDRVSPFLDGAAFIGMKAQKELGNAAPIYVVPVSIKATHTTDVRPHLRERLGRLADAMETRFDESAPFPDEVKRIGMVALERSLKHRGLIPQEPAGNDIRGHLEHCATLMIERLEGKMGLRPRPRTGLNDRIRKIRSRIHKTRTDPEAKADHPVAITWADEAILALRILSYAGNYLDEAPSVDRCAESVEKLLEDVYSEIQPPLGDREAIVRINRPIKLADHLEPFTTDARECVSDLTRQFESSIQSGLHAIGSENTHLGTQPM